MNAAELIAHQRAFFQLKKTYPLDFRMAQLKKLEECMRNNEQLFFDAIYSDLKKSRFDTITTELSIVYSEIAYTLRHLPRWIRKHFVATNLVNMPARSYRLASPYGVTCIIGAWNYPIQLVLLPLVSAIAAGNTAVVKPSELAPKTSATIAKIINENFPSDYIHVVEGDAAVSQSLLEQKFDHIFFTGGTTIGKIVYEAAAKHLTPVTLELGGKNPAIVMSDCNIKVTAQRIVWGKFLNAGQTCIAPDYVLVHSSIEKALLAEIQFLLEKYYSTNTITENFMAIVNEKHFERLRSLIIPEKIFYGGTTNAETKFISPTVLYNISFNDAVMKEEIFGPILPVIRFDTVNEILPLIQRTERSLSFYVFGKENDETDTLFNEVSFGGGALNDVVMYFVNKNLPFGGIGASGIGSYHGYEGFKTFSHFKSVMIKPTWFEAAFLKTPPYTEWKLKLLRFILEKL
jgi:aldehyde dehydrogenase (NAD+)